MTAGRGILERLFGARGEPDTEPAGHDLGPVLLPDETPDYVETRELARHADPDVRRALARREDVRPEILYFMAEDKVAAVRREIAANRATPGHADLVLARDDDDEVRCDLARKIGRLLPDLDPDEASRVRELALETLEILALDQLPRVRAVLAEELKQTSRVPKATVLLLAHDVEAIVAAPVLEYSPLLNDDDLLEIIATGCVGSALSGIARRHGVTPPVADALVATLDVPAVAALLANKSAQIREETLDAIIEHAETVERWHEPLVLRAELSLRAIRRISQFVAASLVDRLAERHGLEDDLAEELRRGVRRRLDAEPAGEDGAAAAARVAELKAGGQLDDDAIADAIERGERTFVLMALAELAALPLPVVRRIVEAKSAKGVTALTWKAGLAMRTAMRLQLRVAAIAPRAVLNARHGIDYPLSPAEMAWQIDYFSS